jgi:hypothetical protein
MPSWRATLEVRKQARLLFPIAIDVVLSRRRAPDAAQRARDRALYAARSGAPLIRGSPCSRPGVGNGSAKRCCAPALDKSDQRLLRLMIKRAGVALRGQRENGIVRSAQGPRQCILREVAG